MLMWLIYVLIAIIVIVLLFAILFGVLDFLFLLGGIGVGYADIEEMVTHSSLIPFSQLLFNSL